MFRTAGHTLWSNLAYSRVEREKVLPPLQRPSWPGAYFSRSDQAMLTPKCYKLTFFFYMKFLWPAFSRPWEISSVKISYRLSGSNSWNNRPCGKQSAENV